MTSESGSGSGDGKRMPRNRIIDVTADSRTVDVATHDETVEFMKTLRDIVESHRLEGEAAYEEAIRKYLAGVPPEKRKRIARGIMGALPGPRPTRR